MQLIRTDRLAECLSIAKSLESSVEQFKVAVACQDTVKMKQIALERHQHSLRLASLIRIHRMLPMGL
eukprot:12698821-Alexandrium_andersonii.AAC.1